MGLGCNGIIQVLIEPLNGSIGQHTIQLLRNATTHRQKSTLVTLFSLADKKGSQQGTCLLLTENNECFGRLPLLEDLLMKEARSVLNTGKSSFKSYNEGSKQIIAFSEIILPAISMVVIGGGNDVFPLVQMADLLGWQTIVIDGRPAYATKERFPVSSCTVLLAKPESVLQQVTIDERTVFVLMTHNYNYDYSMLRALLSKEPIYIGILGPAKKMEMMEHDLRLEGIELTSKQRSVIYGPVGLDIGAETAEEIALSIMAEIKAVLSEREPGSLKDNAGEIHERSDLKIEKVETASGITEKL
jgi:xanthine dehydrogenase accessory factor